MTYNQEAEPDFSALAEGPISPGLKACASICARSRLKRFIDIAGSSFGLAVLTPGLSLIALAIFLQDGGPVFYRQTRTGLDQKPFQVWKFRTMLHQKAKVPFEQTKGPDDPRVTRLGRLLRALSLDELPQLFNVLVGEMSLVGPRPHPIELDALLAPQFPAYTLRYCVKPGLTGQAQINGARGPIITLADMQKRLQFDLQYIRDWSIRGDITIILKTLRALNAGKNAY
ncbi:MAG: sugar transferase [Roseibium sp.]|nr:sugar transferase [Roseibium sp.]